MLLYKLLLLLPPLVGEQGLQKKHRMCFCTSGGANFPVQREDWARGRVRSSAHPLTANRLCYSTPYPSTPYLSSS